MCACGPGSVTGDPQQVGGAQGSTDRWAETEYASVHTMEGDATRPAHGALTPATAWLDLEGIVCSEINPNTEGQVFYDATSRRSLEHPVRRVRGRLEVPGTGGDGARGRWVHSFCWGRWKSVRCRPWGCGGEGRGVLCHRVDTWECENSPYKCLPLACTCGDPLSRPVPGWAGERRTSCLISPGTASGPPRGLLPGRGAQRERPRVAVAEGTLGLSPSSWLCFQKPPRVT